MQACQIRVLELPKGNKSLRLGSPGQRDMGGERDGEREKDERSDVGTETCALFAAGELMLEFGSREIDSPIGTQPSN